MTMGMPQTEGYENHIFSENRDGDVNQFDYTETANLIRLRRMKRREPLAKAGGTL